MKKYIFGVDGGNTKTDYFLFDLEGNFIDGKRAGTCSHEALKDSFDGSYRVMNQEITELLSRNNLTPADITAAVFGLAGVDVPFQQKRLEEIVEKIGFKNYRVVNDGFLGIKAASPNGVGVCSINGTGTVTTGIDEEGNILQIGGIGYISGDEAGGSFFARRVVQAAYDEAFRFGKKTILTKIVFDALEITDKSDFQNAIVEKFYQRKVNHTHLIQSLFKAANDGDQVSIEILEKAGENMARSVAGCIDNLNYIKPVNVIMAGSVWVHATSDYMVNSFKKWVNDLTKKECNYIILRVPPATGAIIWAMELANKTLPTEEQKQIVFTNVEEYQRSLNK